MSKISPAFRAVIGKIRDLNRKFMIMLEANIKETDALMKKVEVMKGKKKMPQFDNLWKLAEKRFLEKYIAKKGVGGDAIAKAKQRIEELSKTTMPMPQHEHQIKEFEQVFLASEMHFNNAKTMRNHIHDEFIPALEEGEKHEKQIMIQKKKAVKLKDISKILASKRISEHELIKLVHVYRGREELLNKAVAGKILMYKGWDITIVGYDRERRSIVFVYEKDTFRIEPEHLSSKLQLLVIHDKIKRIKPYGKSTLGHILELEESKVKGLEGWSKISKMPKKFWITKHEQDMVLRLKHSLREKEKAAAEKLKKKPKLVHA